MMGVQTCALPISAAIFFILISAFLFQYFLAVTQASQLVADALTSLPIPPIGYEYVRVGDDVLLVDMFSGRVVQVIYDVFW